MSKELPTYDNEAHPRSTAVSLEEKDGGSETSDDLFEYNKPCFSGFASYGMSKERPTHDNEAHPGSMAVSLEEKDGWRETSEDLCVTFICRSKPLETTMRTIEQLTRGQAEKSMLWHMCLQVQQDKQTKEIRLKLDENRDLVMALLDIALLDSEEPARVNPTVDPSLVANLALRIGCHAISQRIIASYGLRNLDLLPSTNNMTVQQRLRGLDLFACATCHSLYTEADMVGTECLYHSGWLSSSDSYSRWNCCGANAETRPFCKPCKRAPHHIAKMKEK
jgi:hypothetical protein